MLEQLLEQPAATGIRRRAPIDAGILRVTSPIEISGATETITGTHGGIPAWVPGDQVHGYPLQLQADERDREQPHQDRAHIPHNGWLGYSGLEYNVLRRQAGGVEPPGRKTEARV